MRIISARKIEQEAAGLAVKANVFLRRDVLSALKAALAKEKNKKARKALSAIIKNASVAAKEGMAICQDTGLPVVFLEVGQEVRVSGDLRRAIDKGIESGYKKAALRSSVVRDPLLRGRPGCSPAVIHTDIVKGSRIKVTLLAKGFGCENKSQLKMFNPTVPFKKVKNFIVEAVRACGADACPPYVVGVGIGGTADYACLLAQKALLKSVVRRSSFVVRAKMEDDLLKEINKLGIGPMGLGGQATCLAVNIQTCPTHIAGLPVAVNISCHALRSAVIEI